MTSNRFQPVLRAIPLVIVLLALLSWGFDPMHLFQRRWREMATMVAGSFIAGSTSEGGGAVAFPVFTKVLHIKPWDSRTFTLGIQSFGMGAASLTILLKRIAINVRVLLVSVIAGLLGMAIGCLFVSLQQAQTRVLFTGVQAALGLFLIYVCVNRFSVVGDGHYDPLTKLVLPVAGLVGGFVSSAIGTGADVLVFGVCVILCRISPHRITPTTILLQWILSVFGFVMHWLVLHDVAPVTFDRLRACIPIVLTFGPVGVIVSQRWFTERRLTALILLLITAEVVSTLILVPLRGSIGVAALSVGVAAGICVAGAFRSHRQASRRASEVKKRASSQA